MFKNEPIILDGHHYVTRLIVREYHKKFNHGRYNIVINEIRQECWITGLRNMLRSITSNCVDCEALRGRPVCPIMSDLAPGHLACGLRPFTHWGVDYFVLMTVKIGRREEKRWGVLLTCLTTWAIHLELAYTLNADSTICALQRMITRRGSPQESYTDCGTNFKGTNKELKEAMLAIDTRKQHEYGI